MRPVVGISAFPRTVETSIGPARLHTASSFYVDSVAEAGAVPVVLPIVAPETVGELVGLVHGVVLTGGGDIDPARYGSTPVPQTHGVDPERDAFDIALLMAAIEADLPVLATCRGMQVVNVALGGSLVQHVPAATGQVHGLSDRWREGVHRVKLEPDSRLAAALGTTEVEVNSIHHQAVCEVAPGAHAVGWAEDGTVEAMELESRPDVVAVQWHPELLGHRPEHRGLFRQLAARAGEVARRGGSGTGGRRAG